MKLSDENSIIRVIGYSLAFLGGAYLVDSLLTGPVLAPAVFSLITVYYLIQSVVNRQKGLIIVSSLLVCGSIPQALSWNEALPTMSRVGWLVAGLGVGFLLAGAAWFILDRQFAWWAGFVGISVIAVGLPLVLEEISVLEFVKWTVTGTGIGLLGWGIGARLFGLIIPGALLASIGAGVYSAWFGVETPDGMTETGIMLVWFALGWGAIIVFSRVLTRRFVWWPLIPGGILAVVGWGLYSGGNPNNALDFIGNTGSLGVLIFGLYLLMMRRGMTR